MFVDCHSHILPGIDDGARTMDDAIAMARQAVEANVSHLVCTPHIHWGRFDNSVQQIASVFEELQQALAVEGVSLSLSFAGEVRANEMVPLWIREGNLPFLGQYKGKKVLLLEMPHSHIPAGFDQLLRWLINEGIQPLIPHPERNRDVWKRPEKIQWLRNFGCLLQVTAGAFVGRFGENVQEIAESMLDRGQIDLVASDTHDTLKRPNDMQVAFDRVIALAGETSAHQLFVDTPKSIVGS